MMPVNRADETIFAVASGAGRAAICVLRVSGPRSRALLEHLCGTCPPARRASVRTLHDDAGEALDQALVLWLPGPASYTGEDCAELHLHGGRGVVDGVADALAALGARPAEPGEFTRRAFLNGRMDLVEAEAIADLVDAETASQRRQALRQLSGALGELYSGWSMRLTVLMAQQEALIDFPDEDLPPDVEGALMAELGVILTEVVGHLADDRRGERLREGIVIAVGGPPNVGKSSLINILARRDVAIVSPFPGTTRDVLEARVVFGGVPVTLLDTAGIRASTDPIEGDGVRRAVARIAEADLVLLVADASAGSVWLESDALPTAGAVLRVVNKIDLAPALPGAIAVSAVTGHGLEALRAELDAAVRRLVERDGPPPLTRARHRAALSEVAVELRGAIMEGLAELRAERLRLATRALGRVIGQIDVEDVLDVVFSRFCIGK